MPKVEKYKRDDSKYIYFSLKISDFGKYFKYTSIIKKRYESGKPISYLVYQKLMNLFIDRNESETKYYQAIVDNICPRVMKFINGRKDYNFNVKIRRKIVQHDIPNYDVDLEESGIGYVTEVYTTEQMIRQAIYIAIECKVKDDKLNQCMKATYQSMRQYLRPNEKLDKSLSHYARTAISGYIAVNVGYELKGLEHYDLEKDIPTVKEVENIVAKRLIKFKPHEKKRKTKKHRK